MKKNCRLPGKARIKECQAESAGQKETGKTPQAEEDTEMKKSILVAALNFVAVIALFALLDMICVKGNATAWVETFIRPVSLGVVGGFALLESMLVLFHKGRTAVAA